jgi:hypothetical protein
MKKLIAAIFVALLTTAGLVATSAGTAQAACPYTQCVATKTTVTAPATVKAGKKASISVRVKPTSGSAQPVGKVVVTIKKVGGGFKQTVSKTVSGGKAVAIVTKRLTKPGKYTVTAAYAPQSGSLFKASQGSKSFRVVRRSA